MFFTVLLFVTVVEGIQFVVMVGYFEVDDILLGGAIFMQICHSGVWKMMCRDLHKKHNIMPCWVQLRSAEIISQSLPHPIK